MHSVRPRKGGCGINVDERAETAPARPGVLERVPHGRAVSNLLPREERAVQCNVYWYGVSPCVAVTCQCAPP